MSKSNYLNIEPDLTIWMKNDLKHPTPKKFDISFRNSFIGAGWSYDDRDDAVERLVNEFTTTGYFFEDDVVHDFGIVLDHSFTEERDVYSVFLREDVINPFIPTIMVHDPMGVFDTPSCLIRDALLAAFPERTVVLSMNYEATVTGKGGLLSDILEYRPPRFYKSVPSKATVADVAVAELTPALPAIPARIQALKGAFALATGQYDDVTDGDIQAAVATGYGNPEVLRGLKDATWLMVEKHRDEAWHQGYNRGYEGKATTVAERAELAAENLVEGVDMFSTEDQDDFAAKVKVLFSLATHDTSNVKFNDYRTHVDHLRRDHWNLVELFRETLASNRREGSTGQSGDVWTLEYADRPE